jgi:hypothetical protein
MLERRLKKGQQFSTPYLGLREFTADVSMANGHKPLKHNLDIGYMFYDRFYPEDAKWMDNPEDDKWSECKSFFFPAQMIDGVIEVPSRKEVMGEYA